MAKYVIIGNSAAGIAAVEAIRGTDKKGEITIISDENFHTYSRPLISYLLCGKTDLNRMKYRNDTFYAETDCKTAFGEKATDIDAAQKTVTTDKGNKYPYDKLLIATGSRPFVPPVKGLETVKSKFTFMSLADALQIEKAVNANSRVFILGAGLIGLKCAEALVKRVKSVALADIADRVLPSVLDSEGAAIVADHLRNNKINLYLGSGVTEFITDKAILSDGNVIEFDILVIASGVRPNVDLIKNAGGAVNRGIIIDNCCKTSLSDIYAAGDCTECIDSVSGERKILALLPNAYMQGYCAGKNMAGVTAEFDKALAMNAVGFFGLHIVTAGIYQGDSYIEKENGNYKKLFFEDNRLKGYIIIGNIDRAGIYTSLIRNKIPLDTVDFELVKKKPQLMAFSKTERQKMLGEVRI
jgi:NAD(P)H-nitrite reductase large subunit